METGSVEEMLVSLGKLVSTGTCAGHFQGDGGALELEQARLDLVEGLCQEKTPDESRATLVGAYSAASSTYYAAAGNARAHFRTEPWRRCHRKLVWLIRTAWYLHGKAWKMSNRMVKRAGGIKNLSADQLDIRASIARKCGRHAEAARCLIEALRRPGLSDNTKVLLLIHVAAEYQRREREKDTVQTFEEIGGIVKWGNVLAMTQIRALRAEAAWHKANGAPAVEIKVLLDEAADLAKAAGLKDQEEKVRAER